MQVEQARVWGGTVASKQAAVMILKFMVTDTGYVWG
jgi:hypothetical protein